MDEQGGGMSGGGIQSTGLVSGLLDFSFTKFITIRFISIIYILILVGMALAWLVAVIGSFAASVGMGLVTLVVGALILLLYIIFIRMWLELVVVLFRIGENTSLLAEKARRDM